MVALSSIEYYVNIVNDQAVLRRLIQSCREIDNKFLNEDIPDVNDFILDSEASDGGKGDDASAEQGRLSH